MILQRERIIEVAAKFGIGPWSGIDFARAIESEIRASLAQPAPVSGAPEMPTLPQLPAPLHRHPILGGMFDRMQMHMYATNHAEGLARLLDSAGYAQPVAVSGAAAERVGGIGRFRDSAEYKAIRQASGSAQQAGKPVALEVRYLLKNCLPSLARCGQKSLIHEINNFLETPSSTVSASTCQQPERMGEHACANRHQCWESCGELGHDVEHAVPSDGPDERKG